MIICQKEIIYRSIVLIFWIGIYGQLLGQKTIIHQLKDSLSSINLNKVTKTDNYLKLGEAYRYINIDSALYFNEMALNLAKKNNLDRFYNKSITNKGLFFYDKSDYLNALNLLKESLEMSELRNDSSLIAITTHAIGSVYLRLEEYEKAVKNYQTALEQFIQQGKKNRILGSFNSLGAVNLNLKRYDKAVEYFEKARINAIENEDTLYQAIALSNIGEVFLEQGKIDTCIILSTKVIDLIEIEAFPLLIVSSLINLTKGYYLQKNYETTLATSKEALAICEKYQLIKHKMDVYEILAQVHLDLEEISRVVDYTEKGLEIVKSLNVKGGALPFYKLLSEAYEADDQFLNALKMERKYSQLKDSLNQLQVEEKIANLEFTAEIKQKDAENALLKEEKKNQDLNIQQKNYAIIAISLGLFSLGIILIQMHLARNKLKHLNQKLELQANELKQNYLFKNRLFGNIAHELRTPLALITGQLNFIAKNSPVDLKLQQKVQIAKNTSQDLLSLTNQILDLTKSEVGLVKTTVATFQLQDLLNYLCLQFEPIAKRKDIALQVITTDEKIELATDVEKLLTILRNLLTNALKYNQPRGHIKLDCKNIGTDVEIVIEDSGQGIPQADLSLIFDRFYQSQQNQTAEGGIGVGLAICKEYIQLLGGTISVQSTLGKGSSFTIRFPQKMTTYTLNIPKYEFPTYPATTHPELPFLQTADKSMEEYVLVVEDNLELSHYIYELLQEEHEVYFAANGREALQQIELQAPIAIITDWMMPVMNGATLIKHLKTSENFAAIPVLMLTARTDIKEQLAVLRIGLDDYLTKPFDAAVLKAHLNHLIEQARQQLHVSKEDELMNQLKTQLLAFDPREQDFLKQVEQIVLKNIASFDLTLEKISQIVGLSERHLSRKIKQLTKLTANQFVNEIRFREAKRMLLEKEYTSVKAVVYSVGFKSEKGFSRNFKKRFGKYPKELLNKIG